MSIEKFCEKNELGKVKTITKLFGGLMHKMFKVETIKGIYCIKVLNPEVMSRSEAYDNFIVSESVSNLAKKNGIPVSSALAIAGNYINKFDDMYYMVFDYVYGLVLKDDEITLEHCRKIGNILAHIHLLDYQEIGLKSSIIEDKKSYNWKDYINNSHFNKMAYKDLYLDNYKKYSSILKRANERFNELNINQTICHSDMDPKNVMWKDNNPIIIDWECAGIANPDRELLEVALSWSGFLSNHFNKDKFTIIFNEYAKYRKIDNIEWYDVICGNLVGRFEWLKYNLDRSLGIITNDEDEKKLAEIEVIKTIDEINRYLALIGDMDDIITNLINRDTNNYDSVIEKIIANNEILKGKTYTSINSGFTNTIYAIDNYIVRICTDLNNEDRFNKEIAFYNENQDNNGIPKLFVSDISKQIVPYYYEVIEKLSGQTLYEIWGSLSNNERKEMAIRIINIVKPLHLKEVKEYDFFNYIKKKIIDLKDKCNLNEDLFNLLIKLSNKYFQDNKFGLIHGDLHFDNFIYDGINLYLIDFEYNMVAPIDYEFRIFNTCKLLPYLWASSKTDMITIEDDYQDLMDMLLHSKNINKKQEIVYFYTATHPIFMGFLKIINLKL